MNGAACFNVDYLKTRTGAAQDAEGEYLKVISTRFACLTGLHPSLTLAGPFMDAACFLKRVCTGIKSGITKFFTACLRNKKQKGNCNF